MARLRISRESIISAMQSKETRDALEAKAHELAARANALGAAAGADMSTRVESGTRPRGRPFSNAVSPNVSQEWGDRYVKRLRILGRVAEEG